MLEPVRAFPICGQVSLCSWNSSRLGREAGVRLYSSGQPGGARSDKLLYQARLALDKELRLRVVQRMYELRFKERPDKNLSVQQLMGIEGFRVKETYRLLAQKYRVTWHGRRYDPKDWEKVISRIAVSVLQPPVCTA